MDESSLASTKHIHKLIRLLEPEDKVVLVGDVRQHQAVEAGSPFQQLQEHGMTTAALTEIVRQPDKEQKQIVEELAARNTPEAVAELISRGKVIEIADERERFEAIAQDYCQESHRHVSHFTRQSRTCRTQFAYPSRTTARGNCKP